VARVSETSPTGAVALGLAERLRLRWLARHAQPAVLAALPEPRLLGQYARGRQMLAGEFLLAGTLLQAHGHVPFSPQPGGVQEELHGFGWLDHLAAVGDGAARQLAQAALVDWITRFGRGAGAGWAPALVGRRVARWIVHAAFVLQGMEARVQAQFLQALALNVAYLEKRAARAAGGLPQIEAQLGRLYAALSLEGMAGLLPDVRAALLRAAQTLVGDDGAIASRNPEELLEVFSHLALAAQVLADQGETPEPELLSLLNICAQTLRCLRHADGGLARFHGGGRGQEGALATALANLARLGGGPARAAGTMAMGYARLAAGRSTVLIDAAAPPRAGAAARAHASTLAFEMTSNRRPLIVSCGDGRDFGPDWHRASRASASHSTLALEGYSSSRFATGRKARLELADGPRAVEVQLRQLAHARIASLGHDGYVPSHGLEHLRQLDLSGDGRALLGEDMLIATSKSARARFDEVIARSGGAGVAFALRFHLHPDAVPVLDGETLAVYVTLPSGEVWVFRAEGHAPVLAPSVYLEKGRVNPRSSQQIMLSLRASDYTTQINWSLAMAENTPRALRDITPDNPLAESRLRDMTQG